jgi:putative hydrolase of the HAD superfamily
MNGSQRFDAVLFDLGGIVVDVGGVERMLQWCPALPDTETLWRRWIESPSVRGYEAGRLAREAFARGVVDEFSLPVDERTFLDAFASWPRRVYDGAAELLDELRPRHLLASLSNTNELHWQRFRDEWNLPALFHHNFPSYAVGRLKPDADYFEHVLATIGVERGRALFVDDNAINVEAAQRVGLVARRALGPQGVREVLVGLGVLR